VNEEQVAGGGVQLWVRTGEPPVQPAGVLVATVRVCWPLVGHVAGAQAVYVNPVHATTGGVQDWDDAGGVPAQPAGEAVTVRVWVPLAEQAPQAPVVYVHAGT
jgi:hypothetical protein